MRNLIQNTAANRMIFLTDAADHVSGKAGATLTITLSKNGGAFTSISPSVTDRGNGWYSVTLTSSHTDTLGDLALHITATGADPADVEDCVIAFNLFTATVSVAAASIQAIWDLALTSITTAGSVGKLIKDNLDAAISSRPTAAAIAAAVWDALTAAAVTAGSFGKLIKDNLDVAISSRPSAATMAAAVWDYLTAAAATAGSFGKLVKDFLNATISSRATPGDIPTVASIAAGVLDASQAAHNINGTIGASINDANLYAQGAYNEAAGANLNAQTASAAAQSAVLILNNNVTPVLSRENGMIETVGGIDRYKASALTQAPAGTGGGGGGSGAFPFTVTVRDAADTGNLLEGAVVSLTKDGVRFVLEAEDGTAAFSLDEGEWTLAVTHPMYFLSAQVVTVDADHDAFNADMDQVAFVPPSPNTILGIGATFTASGEVAPHARVEFRLRAVRDDDTGGELFTGAVEAIVSGDVGEISAVLRRNADYEMSTDGRKWVAFTTPEGGGSFALPRIIPDRRN